MSLTATRNRTGTISARPLVASVLLLVLGASGSGPLHGDAPGGPAALEAKAAREAANKALVRRWLDELWDQGDYAVANELLVPDFRRHSAEYPANDPAAYAAIVKSCHDAFPDTRISLVDELIADGDRVFVRWRWTGTHRAAFRGIAATGRAIDVLGEDVIRIQDGRITDVWPLFDPLRLMLQLGAIERLAPAE
jgi:steroid delta-isomerase-like uncharacterized protein